MDQNRRSVGHLALRNPSANAPDRSPVRPRPPSTCCSTASQFLHGLGRPPPPPCPPPDMPHSAAPQPGRGVGCGAAVGRTECDGGAAGWRGLARRDGRRGGPGRAGGERGGRAGRTGRRAGGRCACWCAAWCSRWSRPRLRCLCCGSWSPGPDVTCRSSRAMAATCWPAAAGTRRRRCPRRGGGAAHKPGGQPDPGVAGAGGGSRPAGLDRPGSASELLADD